MSKVEFQHVVELVQMLMVLVVLGLGVYKSHIQTLVVVTLHVVMVRMVMDQVVYLHPMMVLLDGMIWLITLEVLV